MSQVEPGLRDGFSLYAGPRPALVEGPSPDGPWLMRADPNTSSPSVVALSRDEASGGGAHCPQCAGWRAAKSKHVEVNSLHLFDPSRGSWIWLGEPQAAVPVGFGYAKLLKLRSKAESTQVDYLRYVRRIATRHGGDPSELTEAQVREHILHLKEAHGYSPSSMRTAVSALSGYYNQHLGRAWKLFDLVSSPSAQTLPMVLTREEIARLFSVVRTPRFLTVFRFIYACGLRIGEAVQLEVGDLRVEGRVRIRLAKGQKDREVPVPPAILQELREFWKTHRHPKFIFPGVGRGWRDGVSALASLATSAEPMGVGSIQTCMRLAVAAARLPKGTVVHTLRHSYATHMLEEGVSIRLISAYLGHASLDGARQRGEGHAVGVTRSEARVIAAGARNAGGSDHKPRWSTPT